MSDPGYIIILIVSFWFIALVAGRVNEKRRAAAFKEKLKKAYGGYPERKYTPEETARIPRYFEKHAGEESFVIDDITADDLDILSLFARVNYCRSAAGEEVLYHTLRSPRFDTGELEQLEEAVENFMRDDELRVEIQTHFAQLGGSGKYSVYDYLDQLDLVEEKSNLPHYLGIAALAASVAIMLFSFTVGFVLLLAVAVYQIVSYYRGKGESDAYLSTFAYIFRMTACASAVRDALNETAEGSVLCKKRGLLEELLGSMGKFGRGAAVLMSSSRMSGSGNPMDVLADYIRMLFHVDLIKFRQMLKEVSLHREDVDSLITQLGGIETAISIACYRASMDGESYCTPELSDGDGGLFIDVEDLRHALLDEGAVANSMSVSGGVLLTGSNASGKSTWLKALGLAALMAQTINTVTAKSYRAPLYRIYSSMALTDNLKDGESYYIVEIRALSRVLEAAKAVGEPPVICFIDEVLRGTNTIERIAASAQILKHFDRGRVLLFAATHDLELTGLLGDIFENYHFEGVLEENDVRFDYKLKKGPSQTRNAIGLLRRFSYDDEITKKAEAMARRFEESGVWSMEGWR